MDDINANGIQFLTKTIRQIQWSTLFITQ